MRQFASVSHQSSGFRSEYSPSNLLQCTCIDPSTRIYLSRLFLQERPPPSLDNVHFIVSMLPNGTQSAVSLCLCCRSLLTCQTDSRGKEKPCGWCSRRWKGPKYCRSTSPSLSATVILPSERRWLTVACPNRDLNDLPYNFAISLRGHLVNGTWIDLDTDCDQ